MPSIWRRKSGCILCAHICSVIFSHRLTPSTIYWRDQSWPRPMRRPSTFTPTMATQVTSCLLALKVQVNNWKLKGMSLIITACTYYFQNGDRTSPNRRLDSSLSLRYPQEHPGGPMEPAHLYQSSGGEPPENRRWCVRRLNQHVKV